MPQRHHTLLLIAGLIALLHASQTGCRTPSEIAVWHPPLATSGLNKRIVVTPLVGPIGLTSLIAKTFQTQQTYVDFGLDVVSAYELSQTDAIQLVGFADGPPSDVALLPVARRAHVDFVLVGEVLNDPISSQKINLQPDDPQMAAKLEALLSTQNKDKVLALSWRVIDVATGKTVWAGPVSVSPAFVAQAYPELAQTIASPDEQLVEAAVRETWKLLTPFVARYSVQLAKPWGTPGAKQIREGNEHAIAGDWPQAECIRQQVADKHRRSHAAIHNLAIAAVARQDYDQAKTRALRALSMRDSELYQETLMWIELRQREYIEAFNLPAPPSRF